MITGACMVLVGLPLGFYGATKFNFGIMATGWFIAASGAIVFVARAVGLG